MDEKDTANDVIPGHEARGLFCHVFCLFLIHGTVPPEVGQNFQTMKRCVSSSFQKFEIAISPILYGVTEIKVTRIWIEWAGWLAFGCMAKFSGFHFIQSPGRSNVVTIRGHSQMTSAERGKGEVPLMT